MRTLWKHLQWPLVVILAVVAGILGYRGFSIFHFSLGEPRSPWDTFYLTLQLFVLESGAVWGPVPWELQVARLLAPATAGYAAIGALAILFREQLERCRIRLFRGHVIVCGLGRKGFLLTKSFRQRGDRVVVIEADAGSDLIESVRERGAVVLLGDARDPRVLARAGANRASYLLAVAGDDGVNAEVAVRAREIAADRRGSSLSCLAHLVDPDLCALLRMQEIGRQMDEPFRLEFFNIFEAGSRTLLHDFPIRSDGEHAAEEQRHIVVVGMGLFGESLILQAGREWHSDVDLSARPLRVTVVDRQATLRVESLVARCPWLGDLCDFQAVDTLFESKEFSEAPFLFDAEGSPAVSCIFVCVDDDSRGLSAALILHRRIKSFGVPVVVRTVQGEGLASLLTEDLVGGRGFAGLHAFGLLDRTCSPDLLLGGVYETLARAIHQEYVRNQEKEGYGPASNPATAPWSELRDVYRESNRAQAAHIGVKLAAAGCEVAPLVDWKPETCTFEPEEVERLAMMEHERWLEERIRLGWRLGPKDPQRKTSPHLVSWNQLDEGIREINRVFVRGLPRFLAGSGFQIARVGEGMRGRPAPAGWRGQDRPWIRVRAPFPGLRIR